MHSLTVYLAPLVLVLGLIIYFIAGNAKVEEVGRISFAFGLLVSLFEYGGKLIR